MPGAEKRVLLVTPDFAPAHGGIQLLLHRLVKNAPRLRVRVLALGSPGAAEFDSGDGLDVHRVWNTDADRRLAGLALNARSLQEAARFRPDVIVSGHVIASLGALLLRRTLGVPFVQYLYAEEFRVRGRLARAAVRRADVSVAISRYTRDLALAVGADPARLRVIPPGVDLPSPSGEAREARPTLLTVASLLFRYKGHDVMLRALPLVRARVPDVQWVVLGDGPFRAALEHSVDAYGLRDAVRILGRVDDRERDAWLDRAHVFCMPSRLPTAGVGGEGFGIAYLEAGAHGLPAIGGDVAGARDAVVHGETGLLVDPVDHLAVADAATQLLADADRAAAMGEASLRHAREHAWPRIGAQVEELLLGVARGHD